MATTDEKNITRHYGVRPPRPNVPCLAADSFLSSVTTATQSLSFPPTVDYLSSFKSWDPLDNNKYGNCNAVAWANQRRLVTGLLSTREIYPDKDQVLAFYKTQNKGFDRGGTKTTHGPGSKDDDGMDIQLGLDELRKNGGPDGVKAIAFAKVDPKKLDEVHQAISIFGSLWICFHTYQTTDDQFDAGEAFSIPNGLKPKGFHAVIVGGYVPKMKCVTWGNVHQFDDSYWNLGGVREAWAVIWPEHLGTRSFMLGVNLGQLDSELRRLTNQNVNIPPAPFSSLYFVKTRDQGSGMTEVHVANQASSYASPTSHSVTSYGAGEGENGVFVIDDADLFLIKTSGAASGSVKLHRATASSDYKEFKVQGATTAFSLDDANNGTWTVDASNLYLVKTKNCTSHNIEVHSVNQSDYGAFYMQLPTSLPESERDNGSFVVYGTNLYFIKYKATCSGHVEVHRLTANSNYQNDKSDESFFENADAENGTWEIGANGDLYFIKTKNTATGMVEVHIATALSGYKKGFHYASWIRQSDAGEGTWHVR